LVGNEFQICAAEMQKARDPTDRLCCGFTSLWEPYDSWDQSQLIVL